MIHRLFGALSFRGVVDVQLFGVFRCVGDMWLIECIHISVCEISGLLESSVYGLNGRISDGTDPLLWCVATEIYVNCLSGV